MLLLILLFIVVPIAEIYVIIQVGQAIGALWTVLLLIADSIIGARLLTWQGRSAWRRFQDAVAAGRTPHNEVLDGVLIVIGGALLLTPGFITDVVGFCLLIPPTRALVRGLVARLARRRVAFTWGVATPPPRAGRGPYAGRRPGPPPAARGYDYEGTAREVTDPAGELPNGGNDDD
jgi:UPF0716 protein FxsA